MAISLYTTSDQSHTLYNDELDETYHSRNGALEEAMHVYLSNGFIARAAGLKDIALLEIGFGTGLNALLTLVETQKHQLTCQYVSLETYPLAPHITNTLNYSGFVPAIFTGAYGRLHEAAWDKAVTINEWFTLHKINKSIHYYEPQQQFDVVYYDAFGPDKQPDMWTPEIFSKLYHSMNSNGIFVTYSAKGDVRRALKQVGFEVELLPGGAGKRNMLRAVKP